jgi:hypothetical protein
MDGHLSQINGEFKVAVTWREDER